MISKEELDSKVARTNKELNGKIFERMIVRDNSILIVFKDRTFIELGVSMSSCWGLNVEIQVRRPRKNASKTKPSV